MTITNGKPALILLVVGLLIAGVAVYVLAAGDGGVGAAESDGAGDAGEAVGASGVEVEDAPEETTRVSYAQPLLTIYPNDERLLVGESTDVFFGRVVEQSGSEGIETRAGFVIPQTQFSVEVDEVIKGDAPGTVNVNQEAGYEDDARKLLRLFEGDRLLVPGREYLFYTSYDEDNDWYTMTVPVDASHVEIGNEAGREKERREVREAKANQARVDPKGPPPPDDPNAGRPCLVEGRQNPPDAPLATLRLPAPQRLRLPLASALRFSPGALDPSGSPVTPRRPGRAGRTLRVR